MLARACTDCVERDTGVCKANTRESRRRVGLALVWHIWCRHSECFPALPQRLIQCPCLSVFSPNLQQRQTGCHACVCAGNFSVSWGLPPYLLSACPIFLPTRSLTWSLLSPSCGCIPERFEFAFEVLTFLSPRFGLLEMFAFLGRFKPLSVISPSSDF